MAVRLFKHLVCARAVMCCRLGGPAQECPMLKKVQPQTILTISSCELSLNWICPHHPPVSPYRFIYWMLPQLSLFETKHGFLTHTPLCHKRCKYVCGSWICIWMGIVKVLALPVQWCLLQTCKNEVHGIWKLLWCSRRVSTTWAGMNWETARGSLFGYWGPVR